MRTPSDKVAALGRMIAQRRGRSGGYLLFLGAGASVTSGCPSGESVLVRYLELLYGCYDASLLRERFANDHYGQTPSFEAVSRAVLRRFGKDSAKEWIRPLFEKVEPSTGYELLAALVKEAYFASSIFTTNWDDAIEQVLPEAKPIVKESDLRNASDYDVRILKLHGDFRDPETMVWAQTALPDWAAEELRVAVRKRSVLFIGYSAVDSDVVNALTRALDTTAPREGWMAGLWRGSPPEPVQDLLQQFGTRDNHLNVDFDTLFHDLRRHCTDRAGEITTKDRGGLRFQTLKKQQAFRIVAYGVPWLPDVPLPSAGRWHAPGDRALYLSLTLEEARRAMNSAPLTRRDLDVIVLQVKLHRVLDLTELGNQAAMGVTLDQLLSHDTSDFEVSRGIAARAREAGSEALLVPTTISPQEKSLVVFVDSLDASSTLVPVARYSLRSAE